jgi:hypothetical protein
LEKISKTSEKNILLLFINGNCKEEFLLIITKRKDNKTKRIKKKLVSNFINIVHVLKLLMKILLVILKEFKKFY